MKLTAQDIKIITCLIYHGDSSAYGISNETSISVPQVTYRLKKLMLSKVVTKHNEDTKTLYSVHLSLQSPELIKQITENLQEIVYLINETEDFSPEGTKAIIGYILEVANVSEYNDEINED